jgi:dCMP deaminase
MRASKVEVMTGIIESVASRGTCDRLQVGAAIARDSRVISTGYNGNVSGAIHCVHRDSDSPCDSAVHAEANAIVFAARHGVAVEGAELWTTHMPCLGCAKLIVNAGIARVWFITDYRLRDGLQLFLDSEIEVFKIKEDLTTFQVTR